MIPLYATARRPTAATGTLTPLPAQHEREFSHALRRHALRRNADAATSRYFTLHQTADVAHASVWRELINKELALDPSAAEAALASAERAARALWAALDGVERQRLARQ
jgi:pyrroloquinoline quinone (PQQ) biosynthesis protein C